MLARAVKLCLAALEALLAASIVLLFIGPTLRLDFLEPKLESAASGLLNRSVEIHGPIRLRVSLQPGLELGRIVVANPRDWPAELGSFLVVEQSRAELELSGLFKGDIHIRNLEFNGAEIRLINRVNHDNNYQFTIPDSGKGAGASKHELSGLDRLSLQNLRLSYVDELSARQYTLEIDEALGRGFPQEPLQFELSGNFNGKACSLAFSGGTLRELLSRSESWLITEGRAALGTVHLDLSGSLDLAQKGEAGYLDLALEGESLSRTGEVFGLSLPEIGAFTLDTRIRFEPGNLQFSAVRLSALENTVAAELVLSLLGDRPHLAGTVTAEVISPDILTPFQGEAPERNNDVEAIDNSSFVLNLDKLRLLDTDLRFRFAEIDLTAIQIQELRGVISLVDGELILPLSFTTANLPVTGQLEISAAGPNSTILADIASPGGDLADLLGAFSADEAMRGQLGDLSLVVKSSGGSAEKLIESLDIEMHLGSSALKNDSGISISAETLNLERQHGRFLAISTTGELFGSPLDLDLRYERGSALRLDLDACRTKLLFAWEAPAQAGGNSAFTISSEGEELCGFLDPVENFLGEDFAYAIKAKGKLESEKLEVEVETARLGEIDVDGSLTLTTDLNNELVLSGSINTPSLDLQMLQPRSGQEREAATPAGQPSTEGYSDDALKQKIELFNQLLALEILPIKRFLAVNTRLDISIDQLLTGAVDLADLKLSLETAKGKLKRSPFQARIGGSLFTGSAAVDTTTNVPQIHFELMTDDFSLAALLQDFHLDQIPDIKAEHVGLDAIFQGHTVKEMLRQASYHAALSRGGAVLPRDPRIPIEISIEQADYVFSPGQPAMMRLHGYLNDRDLAAEMTADGIFARGTETPIAVALQAELADIRLEIDGQINRKKGSGESFHLSTSLLGQRMDDLDELLGVSMPPLGPYEIGGTLASRKERSIGLYDMALKVGSSTLLGESVLSFSPDAESQAGVKATLHSSLSAPTIQLNDFRFGDWSPVLGYEQEDIDSVTESAETEADQNRLLNIFSEDLAKQIDGALTVEVQEVLSGPDMLGHGSLSARLEDGRYTVDTLELAVPGGAVSMNGGLSWTENDEITADASMRIRQFDYGILGRRIKPDSELKGEVNLQLDINARASKPEQLKEHLNGHLRLGIVPEEYKAGVLDLWAVNILTAALPALLKGSSSTVNCVVGDFLLEDGIMRPEVFLLDTSKMRVQGEGTIDFKTDRIDFHLKPTPKSAQFFSLATPISVNGPILKPDIGVTPAGVVGTVFRQATSVLTVPLQWLFSKRMDADGKQVCAQAMSWVESDGKRSGE